VVVPPQLRVKFCPSSLEKKHWVEAVKIYVAAVEALRKKERQDETQFTTKFDEQTSLGPGYFVLWKF
jgi:hypothetical protein